MVCVIWLLKAPRSQQLTNVEAKKSGITVDTNRRTLMKTKNVEYDNRDVWKQCART